MHALGRPDKEAIGLVLAGGRASRFGADKLAVDLAGRPVLHHAIVAVAAVTGRVLVSLARAAPQPTLPAIGRPIEVVRDRSGDLGPLAGLAAALDAIGSTTDQRLLVVPGDAPFLRPPLLRGLLGALDHADAVVLADGDDWRPLPCALRTIAAGAIVAARLAVPDHSVRGALRVLRPAIVEESAWRAWDPQGVWRDDIDEPADIARTAARTHREAT
jgi:molybdopterin-guanine dinucleotide biosynthesis protein A